MLQFYSQAISEKTIITVVAWPKTYANILTYGTYHWFPCIQHLLTIFKIFFVTDVTGKSGSLT